MDRGEKQFVRVRIPILQENGMGTNILMDTDKLVDVDDGGVRMV